MKLQLFTLILSGSFFVACSPAYTYFTRSLYAQENWTQDDIMRIQFYNSDDIVLSRTMNDDETSISEGKIKIINGRKVQQVVIKAGTPGVCVFMPDVDRFAISFEDKDNEAYLMFGPNPKNEDRVSLLAQDWEKENGQVHYKGKLYDVDSSSAFASLMVDLKREGADQYETHQVNGRILK